MECAEEADLRTDMISFERYEEIAKKSDSKAYIPVFTRIPKPDAQPAEIYAAMSPEHGFLLESMEGIPKRAVRSIIGSSPLATFSISDELEISGHKAQFFSDLFSDQGNLSAAEILRTILRGISAYSPKPGMFSGGMAGYCRYDLVREITGGMVKARREDGPTIRFMIPGDLVVFDHVTDSCLLIAGTIVQKGDDIKHQYDDAVRRVRAMQQKIAHTPKRESIPTFSQEKCILPDHDRALYENAVRTALDHIKAGDIFQVVLSRRFSFPYRAEPYRIYEILRLINPSPYLYYFNFGDEAIIGSSPEMLVKSDGKTVTTVPIAGTRPRGKTEAEDAKLAEELLADPKERAEHLMLVDLARNDIGKVSAFGTVQVLDFMTIDKFSHVQHITSVVTGELENGKDAVDALVACFPAGTVSGAPKIRAMQIIEELEPIPRGIYAGAVGYLGFDRQMEFAIAIRTVIVRDNIATCQAGAGIVADSIPSCEFEETQAKAGAMAQAIFSAGRLS